MLQNSGQIGAVRAPGGGWRLPETVETTENPNAGKPTLSLPGPRETLSVTSGVTVTAPVHTNRSESTLARSGKPLPASSTISHLCQTERDRRAALEAIRGLVDHVTAMNAEFEDGEDDYLTAVPSRPQGTASWLTSGTLTMPCGSTSAKVPRTNPMT